MSICSFCQQKPVYAKGLCSTCYRRAKNNGGDPTYRHVRKIVTCSACGADKLHKAQGLCGACYARLRKRGTTDYKQPAKDNPCTVCGSTPTVAKSLCRACYQRQWKYGDTEYRKRGRSICSVADCERHVVSHGYCQKHWSRVVKTGNPHQTLRSPRWGKHHDHPLYSVWNQMRQRCLNSRNADYPRYGGRGIKICQQWDDFWTFVSDMGDRPTPTHTLDRKDNHGDYAPHNCRWATPQEQAQNRTNSVVSIEAASKIKRLYEAQFTVREIADMLMLPYDNVYTVVKQGTFSNAE